MEGKGRDESRKGIYNHCCVGEHKNLASQKSQSKVERVQTTWSSQSGKVFAWALCPPDHDPSRSMGFPWV